MSNINIRKVKDAVTKEEFYPQTCIEAVVDENGDALGIDASPTDDSNKLVRSGGVKTAIDGEATARADADSALGIRIDGANLGIKAAIAAVNAEQQRAVQAENAKYVKPAGGIPKVDLASDVQASLELAQDVVYDISAHNNNTAYADRAAALGKDGANIPQSLRKGGMSIKYIQSSDNKYVQYRLTANEWSIDTNDWIIDGGIYVENPEFVRVVTDNEDKILYGVKSDGEFYFGAGCPSQVKNYVQAQIDILMGQDDTTEKIDTINEMIAFFEDIRHDETLQNLLTNKVDKEEGKSLISTQYIEETENPEFVKVVLDSDSKILYGVKEDGSFYFGAGCPQQVINYIQQKIEELSLEDIIAFLDGLEEGEMTLQELLDSKVTVEEGMRLSHNDYTDNEKEVVNIQDLVNNPEFISVEKDNENKIIGARKVDGTKVENMPIEVRSATFTSLDNPEWLKLLIDSEGRIIEGVDKEGNHSFAVIPKQISEYVKNIVAAQTDYINNSLGVDTYDNQPTIDLDNPLHTLLKCMSYIASIKEWGVIGASFESGLFEYKKLSDGTYGSTTSRDFYSWPQILGRINQNNFTNFTLPGNSMKNWCLNQTENGWGDGTVGASANPKQAYIIVVTSNDADENKGPATAGNIDTDVDFSDYNNNADTEAGWVCGIIQRIRSVAPHSFIFLSTIRNAASSIPSTVERIKSFNEIIRQVPSHFDKVYLLDIYKYGLDFHDSRIISKYMVNNHMSPAGYLLRAYEFNTYIDAIMRENATDFKYSAYVNTELESDINWDNY